MATDNGLVVPVIKNIDRKGVLEIAKEISELSSMARNGTLKNDSMQGGCMTISSLGGIGGNYFTPIINAPEVSILGLGRSEIKPFGMVKSLNQNYFYHSHFLMTIELLMELKVQCLFLNYVKYLDEFRRTLL